MFWYVSNFIVYKRYIQSLNLTGLRFKFISNIMKNTLFDKMHFGDTYSCYITWWRNLQKSIKKNLNSSYRTLYDVYFQELGIRVSQLIIGMH